jgi:hypothetical protein
MVESPRYSWEGAHLFLKSNSLKFTIHSRGGTKKISIVTAFDDLFFSQIFMHIIDSNDNSTILVLGFDGEVRMKT